MSMARLKFGCRGAQGRSFAIGPVKEGRLRKTCKCDAALRWRISPPVVAMPRFPVTEDAHPKNMSTFEADEHLRRCKAGPGTYWYAESAAKVLG